MLGCIKSMYCNVYRFCAVSLLLRVFLPASQEFDYKYSHLMHSSAYLFTDTFNCFECIKILLMIKSSNFQIENITIAW